MMQPSMNNAAKALNKDSAISPSASNDPGAPQALIDDNWLYETYSASGYWYYNTYTMSSSDYHLIWLYTTASATFSLFPNSSYTGAIDASFSTYGIDWLVHRPASAQVMYPRVYMGSSGTGYIEAESGYDILTEESYGFSLSASEAGELFEVYLYTSEKYAITVDVPSTGDFALFVFYQNSGEISGYDSHDTNSGGLGTDERITLAPPLYTGTYAIVILRLSGSGTGYIEVAIIPDVPGFEISFIIMALAAAILLGLGFFNKNKKFLF